MADLKSKPIFHGMSLGRVVLPVVLLCLATSFLLNSFVWPPAVVRAVDGGASRAVADIDVSTFPVEAGGPKQTGIVFVGDVLNPRDDMTVRARIMVVRGHDPNDLSDVAWDHRFEGEAEAVARGRHFRRSYAQSFPLGPGDYLVVASLVDTSRTMTESQRKGRLPDDEGMYLRYTVKRIVVD
jgi:hypothetical protein